MTVEDWLGRLERREARVGIVGLGYVGLPLALLFAEAGFRVMGFDVDPEKVARLNAGESYIFRIEAAEIAAARAAGFRATGDFAEVAEVDAVLICVPTPLSEPAALSGGHVPDMSYVVATMESIAPHLRDGQMVVLESTTYPGTTEEIVVATIERYGRVVIRDGGGPTQVSESRPGAPTPAPEKQIPFGNDNKGDDNKGDDKKGDDKKGDDSKGDDNGRGGVLVAFSPEREDPGNVTTPRREIPKVVGGVGRAATEVACALYRCVFHETVAMSSPAAAEMTKLLENIYRCVNIALVNEMKQLCERMGIDIWEVIAAAKTKPFGFQAFYPGPGVGGHCIPVDPFYLSWKGEQMGFRTRFIELAGEVNESMPRYVVEAAERALAGSGFRVQGSGSSEPKRASALAGARVLVLGVAYKRDVDDLRESPALRILEMLRVAGAEVAYNDPYFPEVGRGRHYDLRMRSTPLDEVSRFDCVIIVTDHSSYDFARIVAEAKLVLDSRNATRGIDSAKIVRC